MRKAIYFSTLQKFNKTLVNLNYKYCGIVGQAKKKKHKIGKYQLPTGIRTLNFFAATN